MTGIVYCSRFSIAAVARTRGGKSASRQRSAALATEARIARALSARSKVFGIERTAAQLGAAFASKQDQPTSRERAKVFRFDGNHRRPVRAVDVPNRSDDSVSNGLPLHVDDDRLEPRRCNLHAL